MGWEWPVCVKILSDSSDAGLRWRRWQCLTPGAAGPGKSSLHSQPEPCRTLLPTHFLSCLIVKNRAVKANHGVEGQCHRINQRHEPAGRRRSQAVNKGERAVF